MPQTFQAQLEHARREILIRALLLAQGNASQAARDLAIPRRTFYRWCDELQLTPQTYRRPPVVP